MASPTFSISVFRDGSIQAVQHGGRGLPSDMRFVRVLHEAEQPAARRYTPARQPEVRPLFPNHFSPFEKYWQLLAWKLNPKLLAGNMTAVYSNTLWISNGQGFGDKTDPRANYFENVHLTYDPPKVEALTCAGNVLHVLGETRAKTNDGIQDCYIVETLDWHNPAPSLEWIEARPWLITHATKLDNDGNVTRFPQGYNHLGYAPGVRHPLIADPRRYPQIVIEKWRVVEWRESFAPDPYQVYS
jgi:hypothetical protein